MNIQSYAQLPKEKVLENLINLRQVTFEVTDACNLCCKYCGYGELYGHYEQRTSKSLSPILAMNLLEYLMSLWKSHRTSSYQSNTYISFYGGEPLLNLPLIKDIVLWIKSKELINCHFLFNMTTNATLLKKNIGFLVEHDIYLLVSLDGNKYNHSYRVDRAGHNSFQRVVDNVRFVQKHYPEYFNKRIQFNAVLHNRNNHSDIINFIQNEFGKVPKISSLNPIGVRLDRLGDFSKMYHDKRADIYQSSKRKQLEDILLIDNLDTKKLNTYLKWYSGNVFQSYSDLLINEGHKQWIPTGTCLPFERKLFVTANGTILPCERIPHEFALGTVTESGVNLDVDDIAHRYNEWYAKYIPQCSCCYANHTCEECMFNNTDLSGCAKCDSYMDKLRNEQYQEAQLQFLADHPHLYKKLMTEIIVH